MRAALGAPRAPLLRPGRVLPRRGATCLPGSGNRRRSALVVVARARSTYLFEVPWEGDDAPHAYQAEQAMMNRYTQLLKESDLLNKLRARSRFERPRDRQKRRFAERMELRKWERKQPGFVPESLQSAGGADVRLEDPFWDYFTLRASWDTLCDDEPAAAAAGSAADAAVVQDGGYAFTRAGMIELGTAMAAEQADAALGYTPSPGAAAGGAGALWGAPLPGAGDAAALSAEQHAVFMSAYDAGVAAAGAGAGSFSGGAGGYSAADAPGLPFMTQSELDGLRQSASAGGFTWTDSGGAAGPAAAGAAPDAQGGAGGLPSWSQPGAQEEQEQAFMQQQLSASWDFAAAAGGGGGVWEASLAASLGTSGAWDQQAAGGAGAGAGGMPWQQAQPPIEWPAAQPVAAHYEQPPAAAVAAAQEQPAQDQPAQEQPAQEQSGAEAGTAAAQEQPGAEAGAAAAQAQPGAEAAAAAAQEPVAVKSRARRPAGRGMQRAAPAAASAPIGEAAGAATASKVPLAAGGKSLEQSKALDELLQGPGLVPASSATGSDEAQPAAAPASSGGGRIRRMVLQRRRSSGSSNGSGGGNGNGSTAAGAAARRPASAPAAASTRQRRGLQGPLVLEGDGSVRGQQQQQQQQQQPVA